MISEKLKSKIGEVYGREIRYPKDCDLLAEDITQKTGLRISSSTTKRLFGFIKSESKPNQYTLDTIANYIGFKTWFEFEATENDKLEEPETKILRKQRRIPNVVFWLLASVVIVLLTLYLIQGAWFTKQEINTTLYPEMPEPRAGGKLIVYNGSLYYIGGTDAEFARNNLWNLNLHNKKWSLLPNMISPRAEMATAVVGSKIYCFGGWLGNKLGMTDVAEVYDLKKNRWDSLPKLPIKLTALNAVAIGTDIYILGGTIRDTKVYFYRYSTTEKTYQTLNTLNVPRMNTTLTVCRGKIYSCGGSAFLGGEYKWHSEVERYDPNTNAWKLMNKMPMALSRSSTYSNENEIHILGGSNNFGANEKYLQNIHLSYNVDEDCWENLKPINIAIAGHQCIEFNDTILIFGGNIEYPNPNKKVIAIVK